MGIFWFARKFFPERYDFPFADIHKDMSQLLFALLHPSKEYLVERLSYMLVHRECGKTSVGTFLFPTYMIYTKGMKLYVRRKFIEPDCDSSTEIIELDSKEDSIVIASETTRRAEGFVTSIKHTIESHTPLAKVFGEKDPRVLVDSVENSRRKAMKVWRINTFLTNDGTSVASIGSGQQTRGIINVLGVRPTLWISDDMYSQKNTKTETSRANLDYWFTAEVLNTLDTRKGKMLWLGTMVHPDTVVKDFRRLEKWTGVERPIIQMEPLQNVLNECNVDGEFKMPKKQWCNDKQAEIIESLSWPDKHSLFSILAKYEQAAIKGNLHYFYQEYINEAIAPEMKMISRNALQDVNFEFVTTNVGKRIRFNYEGISWEGSYILHLGLDPASSVSLKSDDTVITVSGYCRVYPYIDGMDWNQSENTIPNGKVFPIIVHQEGGKYSIHNYQAMKGMCEAIFRLINTYDIDVLKVEANGQQMHIIREINQYLVDKGVFKPLWEEFNTIDKSERILSIILPIIQHYGVILHSKQLNAERLYYQLLTVGIADHDDYADSLSISIKDIVPPSATTPRSRAYHVLAHSDALTTHPDMWQFR